METDAEASGIQTWLFGFVRVTADHKPNTPFSDVSRPHGVANPCAHRGNRIGGHKNRSFLYGTVRPRVISECGNMNNPRPLAYEACLKRTCADSASLDAMESASWHRKPSKEIRNSVSTSPGTDQFTRLGSRLVLCTAGFASVRSTISRYGVDCQSMQAFTPLAGTCVSATV